jgi:predicted metal-dependent peptidase
MAVKGHGTANDIAPDTSKAGGNLLYDLVEDFDVDPHIISLMFNEPFFAKILRGITKTCTKAIPTAGVLAKDGDLKMWYNPGFMASLKDLQVRGLLKHEAMHLALMHTTTRRLEPHNVHNYAADLAINSSIPEEELPDGGLIPGKEFAPLTDEQKEKMSDDAQARYDRMSQFIAELPKGLSTEEYFARLMNDSQIKKDLEDQEKGKGQPGELGEGEGAPGGMDDHDGWDSLSDEEKELAAAKVKQAVAQAVKECDQKGQWGSVPTATQAEIRKLISNEIPWQAVLKKFVGFTKRSIRSTSWGKINKKSPMIMPGSRKKTTASIAVYIDQSGSVSCGELELLFGELQSLAKHTEFTTFHFDCTVDEKSETLWRKGRGQAPHRTRSGGTCFTAVQNHAIKNKHRFDGYLVLTDGWASNPGPSRMKRGWVITTNGDVQDWMGGRDFVIKMKRVVAEAA